MSSDNINKLVSEIRSGETRAIARVLSRIEDDGEATDELLDRLFPDVGGAYRVGITGPPGSGKSSLVTRLTERFIDREQSVGIVAVDPSSPFSGGALLGDRVRMSEIRHPLVFIRSMASRGTSGGLAPTTLQACDVLDASGKDLLLIETVGVGQSEVDVQALVDTIVLVLTPESGDSIQAMKAGLMEIGDPIVINKKDRGGADRVEQELRTILNMRGTTTSGEVDQQEERDVEILQTSARDDEGLDELFDLLIERSMNGTASRSSERLLSQLDLVLQGRLIDNFERNTSLAERKRNAIERIQNGEISPYGAAREIVRELGISQK